MLNRDELLQLDQESLVEIILQLQAQVQTLNQRLSELQARLNKNSRNSSKPPSSDGLTKPKPKSLRKKGTRKSGGQPGHKGHALKLVEEPDHVVTLRADVCACCSAAEIALAPVEVYERRQVFDIPQPKLEITEYRAEVKRCPQCGERIKGEFPTGVSAPTQYGPRFNALLVYLNQQQLLPAGRTVQLMQDIFGQKVSQGTLFHAVNTCHDQLAGVEEAIKNQLREGSILHSDDWLHVACTERLTFYGVHEKRGRIAMDEFDILPDFVGRLIHDFWRPYWTYDCEHGLCNAHHLRELLFLFEEHQQVWAGKMTEILLDMHSFTLKRKETPSVQLTDEEKAPFLKRYRTARAGVLDIDPQHVVGGDRAVHMDLPAVPVVLDRVGQEVEEDLLQPPAVGAHHEVRRVAETKVHVQLFRHARDQWHAFLQRVAWVHVADLHRKAAGFDFREVENLVNQAQQVLAAGIDLLDIASVFRAQLGLGVEFEQLGEAENGVERRAQFVAHRRQEIGFGPVGRFGRVARGDQVLFRPLQRQYVFKVGLFDFAKLAQILQHHDRADDRAAIEKRRNRDAGVDHRAVAPHQAAFLVLNPFAAGEAGVDGTKPVARVPGIAEHLVTWFGERFLQAPAGHPFGGGVYVDQLAAQIAHIDRVVHAFEDGAGHDVVAARRCVRATCLCFPVRHVYGRFCHGAE